MGRIIVKKVRGMSLWAKGALTLTATLLVTIFMYQGWLKPLLSGAATTTYYLNALPATSVGVDGTTNMTSLATTTYDVPTNGATNTFRGLMNTTPPSGTSRIRAYDSTASYVNYTDQEYYRAYTPAYTVDTRIDPNALAEFECYVRTSWGGSPSASFKVQLFDYNPATGGVVQIGSTVTKTLATNTTALQRFVNGTGTAVNFGNAAYKMLAGHRLEVRYLGTAVNCDPILLVNQAASSAPSGTSRLIVTETVIGDVTIGNGSAEPASITVGPSVDGTTSYPVDTFSVQLSSPIYDTLDTVNVTLAAGMSQYVSRVLIASADNVTTYGSAAAPTSGDVWTVQLAGLLPSTTLTNYHVRIIPKSHADVPAPPGGTYAITALITAATHSQLGNMTVSDSSSATVTIDNSSPADATWGAITPGNAQVALSWTNPGSDFAGVVILRNTTPIVGDPIEGRTYAVGNTVGTAQVVYVGTGTTFIDTGVANGTGYYYMIHAYDAFHNYAVGVTAGPYVPVNPNMTNPGVPSAIAVNSTSIMVTMPYTGDPNANNTYTVNYRVSGAGSWTNWGTGSHTASPYATTITGLDSANLYDVQCIYNDPDSINVEGFPTTYTVEIAGIALPAYSVAPGVVAVDALGTSTINVYVPYANDLNGNSTYKVEYKLSTDSTWKTWISGGNHEPSPYTTAIAGLKADTAYDVRVTFQDPDGVNGGSPAVQTFTGVQTAPTLSIGLTHNSDRFPGTTKWGGKWGVVGGQYGDITCINCHQPGAPNIKSLRPTLNPANSSVTAVYYPGGADAPVAFRNVTSMGDDSTAHTSSVRVCEACHSQNRFHNANASAQTSKVHYNRTDCVTCHPHNVGFKATCDICHGLPPIDSKTDGSTKTGLVWRSGPATSPTVPTGATSPANPGAHATHAVTRHFKCDTCHTGTPMPDVNKLITLGFNANPTNTPGFKGSIVMGNFSGHTPLLNGYGFQSGNAGTTVKTGATYANTCSVACHGNWSGSGGSVYRPSWVGTSQAACGACHGTTAGNPPTRGSHTKHASSAYYGFGCTTCHPSVTDNSHINASVKIALNSSDTRIGASARYNGFLNYSTGAPAPSATYRQCTNIYCHSDGKSSPTYASPTWGTTLSCTGCHGNYNTNGGAGTALSGKHAAHVNNATVFGTNTGFGCESCHAKTVSNSTTISNTANHVNKFIDYSGAFANDNYNTGTKQCQNLYCHSNGNRKNIVYVTPAIWTSATAYGCNGCHGTSNAATGAPDYANGGVGSTTANSHAIHVTRLGITSTTGCYFCHANTVDSATANKLSGVAPMRHINGTVDVVPGGTFTIGGTVSFTYNAATMTCTNVSCHGNTSATWGDNNCVECHSVSQGNRVAVGSQFSAQSHHIQGNFTNTQLNVRCYQCHWEADSNGYIATAYHAGTTGSGKGVTLVLQGAGARPATYAAGAFAVYTSGGATNSTRAQIAKINTVCIKCHNAANAAYQPFGDGKTPEQYAWDGYSIDERYSQVGTVTWGKYSSAQALTNNKKKAIKAYSAHGNATANKRGWVGTALGAGADTPSYTAATSNVYCFDCHNSHGTAASGTMSTYSSATGRNKGAILKSTVAGKGGYTAAYTPTAGGSSAAGSMNVYNPGAALCFNCHNNATASASYPWGYSGTYGAGQVIYGYWDTPYFGAGTFASATRYAYKANHATNMGGHFGASSGGLTTAVSKPTLPNAGVTISAGINGLCTPCHDPHGVSPGLGANQPYGVPLLKGTWLTSMYREDTAPANVTESRGGGSKVAVQTSGSTPMYHIDQNTLGTQTNTSQQSGTAPSWSKTNGTRVTEVVTQFGGLCTGCHTQAALAPKAGLNVAPDTWKSVSRIHGTVKGWATTASASDGNYNNTMHSFTCSKCHAPHNARLPRLMVTNCLDGNHRGRVASGAVFGYDSASGSSGAGGGRGPGGGGGLGSRDKFPGPWFFGKNPTSKSTTANIITCHNVTNAAGSGTANVNQQWNSKTMW